MTAVTKGLHLYKISDPKSLSAPAPGLYTCIKTWKIMYKIRLQREFFETCNTWAEWQSYSVDIRVLSTGIYLVSNKCFANDVSVISKRKKKKKKKKRSPSYVFSVVKRTFKKCDFPDFRFYFSNLTNKTFLIWFDVNFQSVFFASNNIKKIIIRPKNLACVYCHMSGEKVGILFYFIIYFQPNDLNSQFGCHYDLPT